MKFLVTGATSRQANPDASNVAKKEVAFAWLFAKALREMGHEVEHRNPTILESYDEFDHVFIGLAPLHGLGSNRAYGVIAASMKLWQTGRLSFFCDDPDVAKVTGGLRTMVSNPGNLVKPFFAYKLEADIAHQPEYAAWLQQGVEMLNEQQWPRLIIPAHPWFAELDKILKKVPQAVGRTTTLDLSVFLPEIEIKDRDAIERTEQWVCEARAEDKWLNQQQPGAPIYRIGKGGDKHRLPDTQLVNLYARSIGVLRTPINPVGWWSSRIGYARQALVPYVTRWQDVQSLGDAYTVLPHTITAMDQDGRDALVQDQAQAFDRAIPSRELCESYINEIITPPKTTEREEEPETVDA